MFKSYIKSAYRSILANKLFSVIHITGLSIGLAACFIMLMIVIHEYSYDKHNDKLDRIYRAYSYSPISDKNWYGAPYVLAEYIKENVPDAEEVAKAQRIGVNVSHPDDEEVFEGRWAYCIDPELFDILTIPAVSGNLREAVKNPQGILISQKIAEQYFPGENPIGKNLNVKCRYPADENTFTVAGVFENFPYTSTFKAEYLLPMKYGEKLLLRLYSYRKDFSLESWSFINALNLFVLINPGANISQIESKFPKYADIAPETRQDYTYKLQPYADVHLNSNYDNWFPYYIDQNKLQLFAGIAGLILLIACLNFVVIATSRIKQKAKDVGIRKVIGAAKRNIASIILTESILYSLLSFPLTIGLVELFNKQIATSLNVKLAEGYSSNFWIISVFLVLTTAIGFAASLYSTFKLTKLTPLQTITYKKNVNEKRIKSTPAFLATQMVVFIALIFCTIIVRQQTAYFKEVDLGFEPKNVLVLYLNEYVEQNYQAFKDELRKSPLINNLGGATNIPPTMGGGFWRERRSDDPNTLIDVWGMSVDYDFLETMEIKVIEGRGLEKSFNTDSTDSFVLNETAMNSINLKLGDRVGKRKVVGVVKDFKYGSLRNKVPSIAIYVGQYKFINELAIRYESGRDYEAIKWAEQVWKRFVPDQPIEYYFMDDKFDDVYKNEYNFAGLVNASAGLAVFIACLGLFGFTVFSTKQRIKEIGIRRVLGASLADILRLFFSQFILLIIVSSVIGIALGDYFISQWLNGFAYKIDILPSYYILAGVISAVIILSTISIYIIKTVSSNPVEALKYE